MGENLADRMAKFDLPETAILRTEDMCELLGLSDARAVRRMVALRHLPPGFNLSNRKAWVFGELIAYFRGRANTVRLEAEKEALRIKGLGV